jgi:hypothetical protein
MYIINAPNASALLPLFFIQLENAVYCFSCTPAEKVAGCELHKLKVELHTGCKVSGAQYEDGGGVFLFHCPFARWLWQWCFCDTKGIRN